MRIAILQKVRGIKLVLPAKVFRLLMTISLAHAAQFGTDTHHGYVKVSPDSQLPTLRIRLCVSLTHRKCDMKRRKLLSNSARLSHRTRANCTIMFY